MKNKKKTGRMLASLLLAIALCLTAVPAQIVQAATPVRVNPQKLTINEGYKSRIMITGTKDKYVIIAYQLGIMKSTSNKKFSPDEALTEGTYNEIVGRLMEVTDASVDAGAVAKKNSGWNGSKVPRDEAIARFYKALVPSFQTKNLVIDSQVGYMIVPFDNQNVCLDVWEESKNEGGTPVAGGTLTFKEKSGSSSQKFVFKF